MDRVKLKENARKSLEGKYGQAIIMLIVFGVIAGIFYIPTAFFANSSETTLSIVQLVCTILTAVATSFLLLGNTSFFLKISRNEEVTWKELFSKTNLWLVCLVATILVNVFTALWSLLFIIPGIIAGFKYSMTLYILADNENITALEAIRKSKEMMEGHKLDYFILNLSFLGWAILGVFTCGLLYLWLGPYMSTAQANFYNSIKDKK